MKSISKVLAILGLAILIALNVSSSMKFNLGGEEVEARGPGTPCYSEVQLNLLHATVFCSNCETIQNYRGVAGSESTCQVQH